MSVHCHHILNRQKINDDEEQENKISKKKKLSKSIIFYII